MIARKYLYLIALAKEKHFGRAAASCNVSSSTLSAAIRDLEIELGAAVVERAQNFTAFTPEGLLVLDYARRVVDQAEALRQDLARSRGGLTGCLRIGVIPTALTVVAALTASFARRHPQATIQVVSLSNQEILNRLAGFALDAGIVYGTIEYGPEYSFLPLWREAHVLITASPEHDDGRQTITWREAAELPLCLLTPDMQNRKIIDKVFADLGKPVAPRLESNSIITILAHVCAGAWCSVVPRALLDQIAIPPGVTVKTLAEPTVAWSTGLVTLARDPLPPLVEAICEEGRGLAALSGKDE